MGNGNREGFGNLGFPDLGKAGCGGKWGKGGIRDFQIWVKQEQVGNRNREGFGNSGFPDLG